MAEIASKRKVRLPCTLYFFPPCFLSLTSFFSFYLSIKTILFAHRNDNLSLTFKCKTKLGHLYWKYLFDMNTRWQYCCIVAVRWTVKSSFYLLILSLIFRESCLLIWYIGLFEEKRSWRYLLLHEHNHTYTLSLKCK